MRSVRLRVKAEGIDEVRFDASVPDFLVTSFSDWIVNYINDGAMFSDGQTLQYGYALLSCHVQSRVLRLLAPDFRTMPIKWVQDLGPMFRILAGHKYTPETFGLAPDIPTLQHTAIIGHRFDEIPMFADRSLPSASNPRDSGWFIGSNRDDVNNSDPAQLQMMSLYQAMLSVPYLIDFLSLPVGCQVLFSGDSPVVFKDEVELEIPKGSYLDRRFNVEQLPRL